MSADGQKEGTPADAGWLNRNVLGMGLASLLSDANHEMATAVLPGFLAALGAPPYALGLIEGIADALASFVKLGGGWWGDRVGHRKAIVTAGYALTGSAKALFAVAAGWPLVLVGRAIAWFGRGFRSPLRSALLAESVSAANRGKAFGFHRAADTIGGIIGPLLGAALLQWLRPYAADNLTYPFRVIFLLTLIPGLGSALVFALFVRERRRTVRAGARFWASVRGLPAAYRRYLLAAGLFGLGDFAPALAILAASQLLAPTWGAVAADQAAALLYAWRNVVYAAASYPAGALSDRWGRYGLLALGFVLGGLTAVGFAVALPLAAGGLPLLVLLFTTSGLSVGLVDALEDAATADVVHDESVRGLAYGVLGTVNGVGDLVSSAVVGLLWSVSPALGFGYAALTMLLGAVLLRGVRRTAPGTAGPA